MTRIIPIACCLVLSFILSSCELADMVTKESMSGTWKVHYQYEGKDETLMPVTFHADHSFTFPVDETTGSGVWTLKDNKLELEFGSRMIWKGMLNETKDEVKKGLMVNSGYGEGGGKWDGKKIE